MKYHSFFLVLTIGRIQGLASVMVKEFWITGWKSKIFGYMSRGERVPEVMTTVWNFVKTGLIASDESKHLESKTSKQYYVCEIICI